MILVISFGLNKSHVRLSKNYVAFFKQKQYQEWDFLGIRWEASGELFPIPRGLYNRQVGMEPDPQCYKYEYIFQQVHTNI